MNVSEIVREKQKSEAIIESIDDPLLLFDASGKLLLMNKASGRDYETQGSLCTWLIPSRLIYRFSAFEGY